MRYVRVDEEQTTPMFVEYYLYPIFSDSDEPDTSLTGLFSMQFQSYDDAATYGMFVMKYPNQAAAVYNSKNILNPLSNEYVNRLGEIDEILIYQELTMYDKDWNYVECPEECIKFVGRLVKEYDEIDKNMMS